MRTILITGASSGIGAELSKFYLQKGFNVALLARRIEPMKKIAESYTEKSIVLKTDICNKENVATSIKKIVERFKRIDLAILNAAVSIPFDISNFDNAILEKTFQTNFFGVANFLEPLIKIMKDQGKGKIATIGSLADVRGFPLAGAYSSSKIALSHLMEAARIELKAHNIKIQHIRPGFIETPLVAENNYPMPFIMSASKAAQKIAKALESNKKVYSFPWQTKLLTQLAKYSPNFLFDKLGNYKKHKS